MELEREEGSGLWVENAGLLKTILSPRLSSAARPGAQRVTSGRSSLLWLSHVSSVSLSQREPGGAGSRSPTPRWPPSGGARRAPGTPRSCPGRPLFAGVGAVLLAGATWPRPGWGLGLPHAGRVTQAAAVPASHEGGWGHSAGEGAVAGVGAGPRAGRGQSRGAQLESP